MSLMSSTRTLFWNFFSRWTKSCHVTSVIYVTKKNIKIYATIRTGLEPAVFSLGGRRVTITPTDQMLP